MITAINRRTLLKSVALSGLASAIGARISLAADEPLGIALVVPSPIGDVGWAMRWPPAWSRSRPPMATR